LRVSSKKPWISPRFFVFQRLKNYFSVMVRMILMFGPALPCGATTKSSSPSPSISPPAAFTPPRNRAAYA